MALDIVKIAVLQRNSVEFDEPIENSSSDYIGVKGIAFDSNENSIISVKNNEITFKDSVNGEKPLSAIGGGPDLNVIIGLIIALG